MLEVLATLGKKVLAISAETLTDDGVTVRVPVIEAVHGPLSRLRRRAEDRRACQPGPRPVELSGGQQVATL